MPRRFLTRLVPLVLALLAGTASADALDDILERGTIRVGVSEFVPWTMKTATGGLVGFEIDVAKKLAGEMGVDPEFKVYSWTDIIPALNRGDIDVIIAGMAITPQRALQLNFTLPYAESGVGLATNTKMTEGIKDLRELNRPQIIVAAAAKTLGSDVAKLVFDDADLRILATGAEAEQAVLGGVMLENTAWERVAEAVSESDFYRHDHRLIFRAMVRLAGRNQPFDVVTLSEDLDREGLIDQVGGLAYLGQLAKNTPSAANIGAYAQIIRERATLRQLISVSSDIADAAFNPKGMQALEVLDEAERKIFSIAESRPKTGGPESVNALLTKAIDRIDTLFNSDGAITGLSTGFNDLDEMTSGLQPADLVIVAGRPSMGKTTFAMNLVENAVLRSEKAVLVFSLEMPGDSLIMRMLSSLGRIDQTKVRSGRLDDDDWPRLTSAVNLLNDRKLFIDDTAGLSPMEMRARARRIVREHGDLALIMIDYLQLMRIGGGGAENRTNEISEISRNLKALAKELEVPVVALSQLNRGLEQRTDKRPVMSDLRESGAIEQDADVVMFVHREEYYRRGEEQQHDRHQRQVDQDRGQQSDVLSEQELPPADRLGEDVVDRPAVDLAADDAPVAQVG